MKIAIIGSRGLKPFDIGEYLPKDITEIVSGGAKGVDSYAEEYANKNGIVVKVFLPKYEKYGRGAPLKRNLEIIDYSDTVIAFWDGKSRGTKFVIDKCKALGKEIIVHYIK